MMSSGCELSNNLDDLSLLDPYEKSIHEGRLEGRESGLQAGYREGFALGRMKALEIGIELGYMHGITTQMLDNFDEKYMTNHKGNANESRSEKIKKGLIELVNAIDSFPSPNEMFAKNCKSISSSENVKSQEKLSAITDHSEDSYRENSLENEFDIAGEMQRMRAKFKLLTVQLKQPNFTLKRVMENMPGNDSQDTRQTNWSNF